MGWVLMGTDNGIGVDMGDRRINANAIQAHNTPIPSPSPPPSLAPSLSISIAQLLKEYIFFSGHNIYGIAKQKQSAGAG